MLSLKSTGKLQLHTAASCRDIARQIVFSPKKERKCMAFFDTGHCGSLAPPLLGATC